MVRTAVKTTLMIALLAISTETVAQQDDHSETTQEYQVVSNGYYANPNYVLPGQPRALPGMLSKQLWTGNHVLPGS